MNFAYAYKRTIKVTIGIPIKSNKFGLNFESDDGDGCTEVGLGADVGKGTDFGAKLGRGASAGLGAYEAGMKQDAVHMGVV